MIIRLDKFLAEMGYGTRSQVKKELARGTVTLNGQVIRKPETKVDTEKDRVCWMDEPAVYAEYEYFMLNKPAGVVSATEDKREKTVIDLLSRDGSEQGMRAARRGDLFPVGRLDKDTEGLLLITNDGELAHRLLSPRKHVDKVYYARIRGRVTDEDREAFARGLDIGDDRPALPAELEILDAGETSEIRVTLREGRFHQIKRMFRAVGKEVVYLKRLSMGSLALDENLAPGEYRRLTEEEVKKLC